MKVVYNVSGKNILKDPVQGITRYDQEQLSKDIMDLMTKYGINELKARMVEGYQEREPRK